MASWKTSTSKVHELSTSFVLGYHGCDRAVGEKLLNNEPFRLSENDHDWLGSGIYFWESNPVRAKVWAEDRAQKKKSSGEKFDPFVVGAVIDLGFCLDLMDSNGIHAVRAAYDSYEATMKALGLSLPKNHSGDDRLNRKLDCAVINYHHAYRESSNQKKYDTVKAVFTEGNEIYPTAGFRDKTHIQICVCNPLNIHGVFRVDERYFANV
jgi:hypothetical protein